MEKYLMPTAKYGGGGPVMLWDSLNFISAYEIFKLSLKQISAVKLRMAHLWLIQQNIDLKSQIYIKMIHLTQNGDSMLNETNERSFGKGVLYKASMGEKQQSAISWKTIFVRFAWINVLKLQVNFSVRNCATAIKYAFMLWLFTYLCRGHVGDD